MALTATLHRWKIALSDVERGVYAALDVRLAQHPSESVRYLVTRAIAYALSYEEGISFSKAGVSSTDEPPIAIRDPTGVLLAWIEIGAPSSERLHKASKAAQRVAVFTSGKLSQLHADARAGAIHRAAAIDIWQMEAAFLDTLGERVDRNMDLELVHSGGRLYVTLRGEVIEGGIELTALLPSG